MARSTALNLIAVAAVGIFAASAATLHTVATFDSAHGQIGENLAFDIHGNLYVSLVLSNEVVKIAPTGAQSTYATFNGPAGTYTTGLVVDDRTGDLFVGQNSVIYVVHPDQSKAVIATFPATSLVNGMTPDFLGNIYVADSFGGYIWRVKATGGTPEIWAASMSVLRILPNGVQETVASAADGLQRTSAVAFGRGTSSFQLYILSALYTETPDARNGVYRLDLFIPGFPVSIP